MDHVALYHLLSDSLACALYDPVWECTMELDDPYYASKDAMGRPEQPRNAFSQAGSTEPHDQ